MKSNDTQWRQWGKRLRAHVRAKSKRWGPIAEGMGLTEPALRHWMNGTRDPNLDDFFKVCALADADPQIILFGSELNPALAPRKAIEKMRTRVNGQQEFIRRSSDQASQ